MLSAAGMPSARNFWSASSSRMPFLATMPITMISPMNEDRLKVVPVTSRATKTPHVESRAEESTATGAAKLPNSNSSTMKTSTIARTSTKDEVPERALLLLVASAVRNADRGRQVQIGHGLLHRHHPGAQVDPLEACRSRRRALQVLAADLGLAGQFRHASPANRASRSCRCR